MPFAALIPLALAAVQAKSESNNRDTQNKGAAINNAFSPLTKQAEQKFDNKNRTAAILATGAVGSLNANQQIKNQALNSQIGNTKLQLLEQQLGQGGAGDLGLNLGAGFGSLVQG